MAKLNILLENNNRGIYFAGQVFKGTIELHLEEPKKVRGLYFVINGRAYCHWTENQRRYDKYTHESRYRRLNFEGEQIYLNQKNYLFGNQGVEPFEMPAGTHRYSFESLLPPMVPASFEAKDGHIRYSIEARLDIPWKFDKESRVQLTVIRNEDLNLYPELMIPLKSDLSHRFCCLFCKSDPLMIEVSLPFRGFAIGSTIPITIDFNNKSDVSVKKTKIYLKRIVSLNSYTPYPDSRTKTEFMCKETKEGVGPAQSKTVVENFQLPNVLVTTNKSFCSVVQVSYELDVEFVPSGCNDSLRVFFPVVIGNVPIDVNQAALYMGGTIENRSFQTLQMPYNPMGNNPVFPMPCNSEKQIQVPYNPAMPMPFNTENQLPYNPGYPMPYNQSGSFPTAPMNQNEKTAPMANPPPPSFDEALKKNLLKGEYQNGDQHQAEVVWNPNQPPSAPTEK